MMRTKWWAVFLMVFCTFFTSTAQIFLKLGSSRLPLIFWNWHLLIGISLYGFAALLLIVSFRGGEVTVLYPIIATSYVWVSLLSRVFLNENISFLRWAGVFAIMLGICFIGWGSRRNHRNEAVL